MSSTIHSKSPGEEVRSVSERLTRKIEQILREPSDEVQLEIDELRAQLEGFGYTCAIVAVMDQHESVKKVQLAIYRIENPPTQH
jgi:RNA 3'-terminal phosphate cyclase